MSGTAIKSVNLSIGNVNLEGRFVNLFCYFCVSMLNCYILMYLVVYIVIIVRQSIIQQNDISHYWPDDPINAKATNKTKRHIKT